MIGIPNDQLGDGTKGSVIHVGISRMGSVRTSIVGRSRLLSRDLSAAHPNYMRRATLGGWIVAFVREPAGRSHFGFHRLRRTVAVPAVEERPLRI